MFLEQTSNQFWKVFSIFKYLFLTLNKPYINDDEVKQILLNSEKAGKISDKDFDELMQIGNYEKRLDKTDVENTLRELERGFAERQDQGQTPQTAQSRIDGKDASIDYESNTGETSELYRPEPEDFIDESEPEGDVDLSFDFSDEETTPEPAKPEPKPNNTSPTDLFGNPSATQSGFGFTDAGGLFASGGAKPIESTVDLANDNAKSREQRLNDLANKNNKITADETKSAYGEKTGEYLNTLKKSNSPEVRAVAEYLIKARNLVLDKGENAKALVEDAADALDLYTLAVQRNSTVITEGKQRRLDGEEYSPEAIAYAKLMEDGKFPARFNHDLSKVETDVKADNPALKNIVPDAEEINPNIGFPANQIRAEQRNFAKEVDKVRSGTDDRYAPPEVMSSAPPLLRRLGLRNAPVEIHRSIINKAINKHNVSPEVLKQLPFELNNPVMVFDSLTDAQAIVVLTELKDNTGLPIVAAVKYASEDGRLRVNVVPSAYGKDRISFANDWVKKGKLKYYNKEKSREWLRNVGLQLSESEAKITANPNILTEDDFVNNPALKHIESSNFVGNYEKGIDAFLDGTLAPHKSLEVGETTPLMKKLGLPELPIGLNQDTLRKTLYGKHRNENINAGMLKDIPSLLKNPIAVLSSNNPDAPAGSVLVVTRRANADGDFISIALHPRRLMNRIEVNKIATIHARDLEKAFPNWNRKGLFRYLNKKMSLELSDGYGSNFAALVQSIPDSHSNILTEDDFVNNPPLKRAEDSPLLAPNGKPSNLTPFQHAQVRTGNFKEFFGDWESAAIKNNYDKLTVTRISGEEISSNFDDIKQFRGQAKEYALENTVGAYTVAALGNKEVNVTKRGIASTLSHNSAEQKTKSIAALPELLKNSVLADSSPDKTGKPVTVHTLISPLEIAGEKFVASLVVKEDTSGRFFYNHELSDIKKLEVLSKLERASDSEVGVAETPQVNPIIRRIFLSDKDNISKVVDENGEPMVVYHGTNRDFDAFSPTHADAEASFGGNAYYFTTSPKDASVYATDHPDRNVSNTGANVQPVFVSIKNPFDSAKSIKIADILNAVKNIPKQWIGLAEIEGKGIHSKLIRAIVSHFDNQLEGQFYYLKEQSFSSNKELQDKKIKGDLIDYLLRQGWKDSFSGNIVNLALKSLGYDGVKYNAKKALGIKEEGDHIIVFNSNQIKSAIGNNGEFSPDNDSILRKIASRRTNEHITAQDNLHQVADKTTHNTVSIRQL